MSGDFSPGGSIENSPAVHCRVQIRRYPSPEGAVEISECEVSVPFPIFMALIQPSLRDLILLLPGPTPEGVGYSHFSLRETADE